MYVIKCGDYGGSYIIQFDKTVAHRKFLRLPEQDILDVPLSAFDKGRSTGVLDFVANIDKPTGWDIRYYDNSAVDLTAPPFNLKTISDVNLCEIYSDSIEGVLKTKLLQLFI